MHFRSDIIPKLHYTYYFTVFHASNTAARSKGVSILISKNCPLQINDTLSDTNVHYLFLKGEIHGRPIILANIYARNVQQVCPSSASHYSSLYPSNLEC